MEVLQPHHPKPTAEFHATRTVLSDLPAAEKQQRRRLRAAFAAAVVH